MEGPSTIEQVKRETMSTMKKAEKGIESNPPKTILNLENVSQQKADNLIRGLEKELDGESITDDLSWPAEHLVDSEHLYELILYSAIINRQGDYVATYERTGIRNARGYTDAFPIKTGASTPVTFKSLGFKAIDLLINKELKIDCPDNVASTLKDYSIVMERPVQDGKKFHIRWQFTWPGCVGFGRCSDSVNTRFAKRIQSMKHELLFEFEPSDCHVLRIKNKEATYHIESLVPQRTSQGKFSLSYVVTNPDADGYVLVWSASATQRE